MNPDNYPSPNGFPWTPRLPAMPPQYRCCIRFTHNNTDYDYDIWFTLFPDNRFSLSLFDDTKLPEITLLAKSDYSSIEELEHSLITFISEKTGAPPSAFVPNHQPEPDDIPTITLNEPHP